MHHHVHVVLFSHKSCASGVSDFCDKTPHTMGTAVTVSVTVSVTAPLTHSQKCLCMFGVVDTGLDPSSHWLAGLMLEL